MNDFSIEKAAEDQVWLDCAGDALQSGVKSVADAGGDAAGKVLDVLHGTWLGHPLHPAVVGIPIGAWSVAGFLDALDNPAADIAIGVGLVGAALSALTGLADYSAIDEKPVKRLGALHALLNGGATVLYAGSLACRAKGKRGFGKALALVGLGLVGTAGYLGGSLVFSKRIGVDHADRESIADDWTPICPPTAVKKGKAKVFEVEGVDVLVTNQNGTYYAIGNKCSHLGGPLNEGDIKEGCATCPWHGSSFRLEDGSVAAGPATFAQPTFNVRVHNGMVEVAQVRDTAGE